MNSLNNKIKDIVQKMTNLEDNIEYKEICCKDFFFKKAKADIKYTEFNSMEIPYIVLNDEIYINLNYKKIAST